MEIPRKAVEITLKISGHNDADLIDRLREAITDLDLFGVRSYVSSDTGVSEVRRNPGQTKEVYDNEVEEYVRQHKRKNTT